MTISSLSSIGSTQQQQSIKNATAKLHAAIASLVSGRRNSDVASVSLATQLQSQTAGLKQISANLAQASSLTQVADGGAEQIQRALAEAREIAQQAKSPVLNDENRKQLNQQLQETLRTIDSIARSTAFNGRNLLDGSTSGDNGLSLDSLISGNGGSNDLSIDSLTSSSLLNGSIDVLSADSADNALNQIASAFSKITSARSDIGAFQQTLDFAAANIETAIVNHEAANASLSDTDFAEGATQYSLADVQRNAAIAAEVQGNKLTPALLKLIG